MELTRDDILKMEAGREMDALIAEWVMKYERDEFDFYYSTVPDGWKRSLTIGNGSDDWKPSRDISAAFTAWENADIFDHPWFELRFVGNIWMCNVSGNEQDSAFGNTKSLAVCRALLLAVMEK